jgi:ribonuclease HI
MGFGWEKNDFRSKNADLWKRLLVIYRNHQVEWIKGTITHRMNVVMYFAVTQSIPLSIDAFYEGKRKSFMKILRV